MRKNNSSGRKMRDLWLKKLVICPLKLLIRIYTEAQKLERSS